MGDHPPREWHTNSNINFVRNNSYTSTHIFCPLIYYLRPFHVLFPLPPSHNTNPGSHSRLFSPPTHHGSCLAFLSREKLSFSSSSTGVELCLPTCLQQYCCCSSVNVMCCIVCWISLKVGSRPAISNMGRAKALKAVCRLWSNRARKGGCDTRTYYILTSIYMHLPTRYCWALTLLVDDW